MSDSIFNTATHRDDVFREKIHIKELTYTRPTVIGYNEAIRAVACTTLRRWVAVELTAQG